MSDSTWTVVVLVGIGFLVMVVCIDKCLRLRSHRRLERSGIGEAVWYSWNSQWGAWKHVVLYTCQHKYELRLEEGTARPRYDCRPCELPEEAKQSVTGIMAGFTWNSRFWGQQYSYRLIGWTNLTPLAIDAICHETIANFGRYSTVLNNCQHFSRDIATRIIPKNQRAYDWPSVSSSTTRVRFGRGRPPSPGTAAV